MVRTPTMKVAVTTSKMPACKLVYWKALIAFVFINFFVRFVLEMNSLKVVILSKDCPPERMTETTHIESTSPQIFEPELNHNKQILSPMGGTNTTKPNIQKKKPPNVIVHGIFSIIQKRRDYIRNTYLSYEDERVCSLDEYVKAFESDQDDQSILTNCRVAYTFVIAGGGDNATTEFVFDEDNDMNDISLDVSQVKGADRNETDIVYLNIKENMENGKTTTWFRYGAMLAEQIPGINYIAKADDDSLFSMEYYLNFTEHNLPPAPFNFNIYGGRSVGNIYRDSYYAEGQFYFMSTNLADYVTNVLTAEKRKELTHIDPTEDMDMGTFVFSHPHPVKFMSLKHNTFWFHPKKTNGRWMYYWESRMHKIPFSDAMLPYDQLCLLRDAELLQHENEENSDMKEQWEKLREQIARHAISSNIPEEFGMISMEE